MKIQHSFFYEFLKEKGHTDQKNEKKGEKMNKNIHLQIILPITNNIPIPICNFKIYERFADCPPDSVNRFLIG